MEPKRTYMNHIKPCICSTCIERLEKVRQEEREGAQKIIKSCPVEIFCSGPCRGGKTVEEWKQEALKKLNIDS